MIPIEPKRTLGSLANVLAEFDAAARHLGLSEDETAVLKEPRRTLRLRLPVQMDDGRTRVFTAYHTVHSTARGPSMGGVQFRPGLTAETVEAFAFWSAHRCALLGIPFGGSYGAVDCDPSLYTVGELERIARQYLTELAWLIKPNLNVLTADIGTNQQIMCWFMDTYSMLFGDSAPAVVLGKPTDLGGAATPVNLGAIGADLCIRRACDAQGFDLRGARVAVQGFGKVGANVARLLHADGAKVVAIQDVSGAYGNEDGIDVKEVVWHQESYGILDGLEGEADVQKLPDPGDFFSIPADVLVLAAVELQVTEANVDAVTARVVAEVAHDPVSPAADRALERRGTLVVPDILCGGGGVAGYYLEWVQNRMGYYWTAERMQEEVRDIVGQAFDAAMAPARERGSRSGSRRR